MTNQTSKAGRKTLSPQRRLRTGNGIIAYSILVMLALTVNADDKAGSVRNEAITPIPLSINVNPDKVALGKKLFNEPRLANNNAMPCAACHQLDQGGDDGLKTSITNTGEPDLINAPTVFNSVYNFRQTWRGQFKTLAAQAEGDIKNPRHGNTSWPELLPKLKAIETYVTEFNKIYSDGINRESVLNAIAEYEKSLITPNAPFDQWLRGDNDAINHEAKKGYQEFKRLGCVTCHHGRKVGGNLFQNFGIFANHFKQTDREPTKADLGRFNVTGREIDKYVFRVPSLRNVAVTGPWFHDGSGETLSEAVRTMGLYQLGRELNDEKVELLVAFLETLTGEYKGESLNKKTTTKPGMDKQP